MLPISEIIKNYHSSGRIPFSFEFSPAKTESGWQKLKSTIAELNRLNPASVSVTYGAGGSTRERTHLLVKEIAAELNLNVVAHLTCEGSSKREIASLLEQYADISIFNLLALKGDVPKDGQRSNDFSYASDLIEFVKGVDQRFAMGAAAFPEGHPASQNRLKEMDFLKRKVDLGVEYLVTQVFFDNHDFLDFRERCRIAGIKVPIIAGIMPICSQANLIRMAELAPRSHYPARMLRAIGRAADDAAIAKVGVHWATEQIDELLASQVDGIHLYTLNTSRAAFEICENLGLATFG